MHGEVEATSCLKQFVALTRNGSEQTHGKTIEKFHKVMVCAYRDISSRFHDVWIATQSKQTQCQGECGAHRSTCAGGG